MGALDDFLADITFCEWVVFVALMFGAFALGVSQK